MTSLTYFETGPHHVLCKIKFTQRHLRFSKWLVIWTNAKPTLRKNYGSSLKIDGVNDTTYPTTTQWAWDDQHVKLPCAPRKYPTEPDYWPEIAQGLSAPILTIRDLTNTMLKWNKQRGGPEWNFYILEAFLNGGKPLQQSEESESTTQGNSGHQGEDSQELSGDTQQRSSIELADEEAVISDKERYEMLLDDSEIISEHSLGDAKVKTETADQILKQDKAADDEGHMYLSKKETIHFFDVVLPRMQQLALRMPELIKVPIPLLSQQQDSAITLSQEQIACLLCHAFFNTFPGRWVPFRHARRRKQFNNRGSHKNRQQDGNHEQNEEETSTLDEGKKDGKHSQKHQQKPHKQQKKKPEPRQSTLFDYFGKPAPTTSAVTFGSEIAQASTHPATSPTKTSGGVGAIKRSVASDGEDAMEDIELPLDMVLEQGPSSQTTREGNEEESDQAKLPRRKLPSINFISLFRAEDRKSASSNVMFAKLRCLFHYFDRVTSDMPNGTVTYHRQVLQRPVDLKKAKRVRTEPFQFSKVTVDLDGPLEDSPVGTLQLDFANKNLGGGALERGAVQEEIRFMICPELILTRLFTEQLQPNEALLIKG
ncbi:hypothetical protein BGW42_005507, partial [Actinomortierella wolfii]